MTVKVYVTEGHQNYPVKRGTIKIRWRGGGISSAHVSNGVAEFSGNGGAFEAIIWYDRMVHGGGRIDYKNPVSVNIS